jgi:LysR family hydrogen peroxide-inducible transcriptional activator
MNLQQLEYILAVDKFKSFSKAADYCNVTQATLSAMVKKLEEELGIILFDRKSQPIVTTEIGKEVLSEAQKVLLHTEKILDIAQKDKKQIAGKAKIGIIPTIAGTLLPKILHPILEKLPHLVLEVKEFTTENIIRKLREGSLDIGILATPLNHTDIEEEILFYEMLIIYGKIPNSKEYLVSTELENEKFWLLEEGNCLRNQSIELCNLQKSHYLPNNLLFEASSFDTLLNMVDELGGLTLIPELYYQNLPENRKQKTAFFQKPIPVREVSLVYYRPFAKISTIQTLAEIIRQSITPILMSSKYRKNDLIILPV